MGVSLVAAVFAVILLYAVPLSCGAYNHIIIVNGTASGESNSTCWEEHDRVVCPSLETLRNEGRITHSLEVVIEGLILNLTELVTFEHFNDIALVGSSGVTVITCMPKEFSGAGLAFVHVRNLKIVDLAFEHCGALHNSTSIDVSTHNTTIMFNSSIFVQWCTNVELSGVKVRKSNGVGVVIFDTNGNVSIADSVFEENMVSDFGNSGGGGMYIEFTARTPGIYWHRIHPQDSLYTIQDCTFQSNVATSPQPPASHFVFEYLDDYQGLGKGGGLFAALRGNTSNCLINVFNCTFESNSALWGGGLHISINDASKENLVNISDCRFLRNSNFGGGGGGAYIAYQSSSYASPTENSIIFEDCMFAENMAMHGGGLILAAHHDSDEFHFTNDSIEFKRCEWLTNRANFGSAVDTIVISPYIFITPKLTFEDCEFIENKVQNDEMEMGDGAVKEVHWGSGAFTVNSFKVWFEKSVYFCDNSGTALSIITSAVSFSSGMNATFVGNCGRRGGAIALMASSEMYVNDSSTFNFTDNSATIHGGAIYAEFADIHDNVSSHRCFIQYRGPPCSLSNEFRNIIFSFARNKVGVGLGGSVYVSSLFPCETQYGTNLSHIDSEREQNISCLAEFVFHDTAHYNNQTGVATVGNEVVVNVNSTLLVIPGKEFDIPVVAKDDLGHDVNSTFHVSIMNAGNINAFVDSAYSYISDTLMKLHGQPGEHGSLILERTGYHELSLFLNFTLLQCPPGYLSDEDKNGIPTCKCAWNLKPYLGLQKCNNTLFQSSILNGYWSGYVGSHETPENLFTGNCPLSFCSYNQKNKFVPVHLLPGNASKKELDEFICGPCRTGVICGKCAANHSVYFHSPEYECKEDKLCHLGWLFYILSELLPLTVIFITVMILNISFTSGDANGFIFFAQVLDTLAVEVNQNYSGISFLIRLERFIYHFFNLDFFSHTSLSFCIKQGATTLDYFAFKYVTVVYALVLVFTTIVVMNLCNLRVYRMFPCVKVNTVKSSVIHGLSAFLVMCYSQCAFVSLRILLPTHLRGLDIRLDRKVVYYDGNIDYLHYDHLPYALPAFVCIITIVAIPPLLLLWYPTGQRLLQYRGLGDTKVVMYVLRLVPIERLKPLLDSFQSCFKDNCRFFAGLYFVYRISALVGYVVVTSLSQFFSFVTVQLSLMLMLHAIAQPYQNHWHNVVDALLFTNLALINGLTLYIYSQEIGGYAKWNSKSIHLASIVQVILIYLPLVCMTTYIVVKIGCKIKLLARKKNLTNSPTEDCDFPPRLIYPHEDSSDSEENSGYHELQEI